MSFVLIAIVVLLIAGIVFVTSRTPLHKSREQFLKELTEYVDGNIDNIEGLEDSYRIKFRYQNVDFFFEDVEDVGFQGKVSRYFLKTRFDDSFNLNFFERDASMRLRSDTAHGTGWDKLQENVLTRIDIPKTFFDLDINTNNFNKAKNLFIDEKTKNILAYFKNYDSRKHPFMSFRIVKGILIIEFHPSLTFQPNIVSLNTNIPSIDTFLNMLITILKGLKKDYS